MKKGKLTRVLITALEIAAITVTSFGCASSTGSSSSPSSAADTSTSSSGSVEGSMKGVTLKVSSTGLFGPFTYFDTDGKTMKGFDIDFLNDLQKILGFSIQNNQLQSMDYSAITASVAEGKLDVAIAALCATDVRKKVMDFSDTYYSSGHVVMINKDNAQGITGVDSLAGKTVAVEKGTSSHVWAAANLTKSTLVVEDTITIAYAALEEKKVDAVLQELPGAAFYIKTTKDTELKVVGSQFDTTDTNYAIAFPKGFKYEQQFNEAIKMLKDNGTMAKLQAKWCSV